MKIVFDGQYYAIRRYGWIFSSYLDLQNKSQWWRRSSKYFPDCRTQSLEEINRIFVRATSVFRPIKPEECKCSTSKP